tara:strand:- start:349 stop:570 length:222 start_codon:yes stop_codon:yes gene_type:complete
MENTTIKFKIKQDGTVEETVSNVTGNTCEKITENIENKLGNLIQRIHSSEYYQEQKQTEDVTLHNYQNQTEGK